jgi:4-amino-4-deoxy-L-arabinose transferase-like glycosyltransferase
LLWTIAAGAFLLAVGLTFRLYDIEADAPAFFADGSQDFTTDGGFLTLYAKNQTLVGEWSLFGYEHWHSFKTSLITGFGYLLFSGFGVSLVTTTLIGIVLSVLGLILLLAVLSRFLSMRELLIAAVFLAFSYVLILYGRFPFSENALLFFTPFIVGGFLFSGDSITGSALVGVLIALAAFFGKAFGLILAAGPIIWWLTEKPVNRYVLIVTLVGSLVATLLACSLIFQGTVELFSFVWTHGTEGHGFPHGLSSPLGFFENLISYARTGLHKYTPFLSLLVYLSLLWLIFFKEQRVHIRKVTTFMASWLVVWIVVLSVFNYRPLRYQYLLIIPMAILAAIWAKPAPETVRRRAKIAWWQILLLILFNWYFAYHLITPFTITSLSLATYLRWVWLILPVAILISLAELALISRKSFRASPRIVAYIAVSMIALSVLNDARLYYNWLPLRTYGIRDANLDIVELLGPTAVISGQYGPSITQGSAVKNFPMFITDPLGESERLLRQYPITHLAIPAALWRNLEKTIPRLAEVPIIARYWLRDNIIYVVPVYDLFGNAEAQKYQPTKYEQGVRAMFTVGSTPPDVYLTDFLKEHPDNRSAMICLYHWYAHTARLSDCAPLVKKMVSRWPTDFAVNLLAAIYYRTQSLATNNPDLMTRANEYLDRAVYYNPVNEDNLRRVFTQSTPEMWTI